MNRKASPVGPMIECAVFRFKSLAQWTLIYTLVLPKSSCREDVRTLKLADLPPRKQVQAEHRRR
jgi:hypothetical protein